MRKINLSVAALLCVALLSFTAPAQDSRPSTTSVSLITAHYRTFGFEPGIGVAADGAFNAGARFQAITHAEFLHERKSRAASGSTWSMSGGVRFFATPNIFLTSSIQAAGWRDDALSKTATRFHYGAGLSTRSGQFLLTAGGYSSFSDPNAGRGASVQAEQNWLRNKRWYEVRTSQSCSIGSFNRLPVSPMRIFGHGCSFGVGLGINWGALRGA